MTSNFYKISCVDPKKECNIVDPLSEKLDFSGYNPVTGRLFNPDDIKAVTDKFLNICVNKNGIKGKCCDPRETRFNVTDEQKERYKDKKFRVNREYGVVTSIDICNNPSECSGGDWVTPNPYLMCKIGDNQPNLKNNVLRFDKLSNDCYAKNCNPQGNEISFGELISGIGKDSESSYLSDLKIVEHLKEDNYDALKKYLDDYKQTYKKSAVNNVLTDTDEGDTILLRAIKLRANKCVNVLFGYSVDLNIKATDSGMAPLHYACKYGDETMVGLLINAGARTDILDSKGRPPFFYAVMYGNMNMIQYLANQNPGVIPMKDKFGNNALHIAMKYAKESGPIVKFLIDNGVSSQVKNKKGNLPSDIANNRLKHLEVLEQEENSEIFLEPFESLAKIEVGKNPKNEEIGHVYTSLSQLGKSEIAENPDIYGGFVTPQSKKVWPINFEEYSCYPYADIENKNKCEKKGGKWSKYNKNHMTTNVKVEYKYDNQDDEEFDNLYETEIDETDKKTGEFYYPTQPTAEPLKKIDMALDHDSLMGITPAPTYGPTTAPPAIASPTLTSLSSSSVPSTKIALNKVSNLIKDNIQKISEPNDEPIAIPSYTKGPESSHKIWYIVGGIILVILLIVIIGAIYYYIKNRQNSVVTSSYSSYTLAGQ